MARTDDGEQTETILIFAIILHSLITTLQFHNQAREYLERAKSDYKGYSLESRLHFRLHSALHKIAHICDGVLSPDVLSDTSSANVSPNVFSTEPHFTFRGE